MLRSPMWLVGHSIMLGNSMLSKGRSMLKQAS
jgi:hypothetical protein